MTQTLNSDAQKNELLQKQFLMMGGMLDQQKKLTPQEIKKIEQDYRTMYFGLTSLNWSQGMTLGMAWQKALEQMWSFIGGKTKNGNQLVNEHLVKIHTRFKQDQSKHIMECTGKESETKLSKEMAKFFQNGGAEMVQKGKEVIDKVYEKYHTEQNVQKNSDGKKFEIAKYNVQKIVQQMLMRQRNA